MKNPFDQFDAEPVAVEPAAAPANPFNEFDEQPVETSDGRMEAGKYAANMRRMISDKSIPVGDILKWSAKEGGTPVANPRAVRTWAKLVRSGKMKPSEVTFDENLDTPMPAIDSGAEQASIRQFNQGATFDFSDEARAMAKAGGLLGDPFQLFSNGWLAAKMQGKEDEFWKRYEDAHAYEEALSRGDYEFHPVASYAGYIPGAVSTAFVPGAKAVQGGNWFTKGLRASALAGGEFALSTAGQNTPENRFENVPTAAGVGAIAGPAIEPVMRVGGRVVEGIANKTGVTDALDKAAVKINDWARRLGVAHPAIWNRIPAEIRQLAERADISPEDVERMREAVQVARRAGVDPRAVDAMTRAEQDVIAAAGRADKGAGRDVLYQQAAEQARTIGSDVTGQFRRVTNVSGNAREMGQRVSERRNYRATEAMDAMRNKPLALDDDLVNILTTQVGQTAIRRVVRALPAEQAEQLRQLPRLVAELAPLGPGARATILRQHPHVLTVGVADRLRIALNDAAEEARRAGRGGEAREIGQLANTLKSAAGRADSDYANYLREYGEDSRTLEAIELGREGFQRNTDEFVDEARALSDTPNAVLNRRDMAPVEGNYEITRRDINSFGGSYDGYQVVRTMPNGEKIKFDISVPNRRAFEAGDRNSDLANVSVTAVMEDGTTLAYGDPRGFNRFGSDVVADAARWFRENLGSQYPHVRAATGGRVGGIRETAGRERSLYEDYAREARYYDRTQSFEDYINEMSDDNLLYRLNRPRNTDISRLRQRIIDNAPEDVRAASAESSTRATERAARRAEQDSQRAAMQEAGWGRSWRNSSGTPGQYERDLIQEVSGHPQGQTAEQYLDQFYSGEEWGLPADVRQRVLAGAEEMRRLRDAANADRQHLYIDDTGNPTNDPAFSGEGNRNQAFGGYAPIDGEVWAERHGFDPDVTAAEFLEEWLESHPDANFTFEDVRSYLRRNGVDVDAETVDGDRARAFVGLITGRATRRADNELRNLEAEATDAVDFSDIDEADAGPSLMDTQQDSLTSNGLTFDEVRQQYDDFVNASIREGEEPLEFETWVRENFFEDEVPQSMWERIRQAGRDMLGDQTGAKRIPTRETIIDAVNRARPAPAPASSGLNQATTQPPGGGVRSVGPSTRYRNERPNYMESGSSFHRIRPGELDAPSDRQLATAEMGRELERRVGEGSPGRAGFEYARRMQSPEQQARNEALMGQETATALNRAMDATLRKAETTARLNPGAGSATAIRSGDDLALGEMMNFFGSAVAGNKIGMLQSLVTGLKNAGMTPTQVENLIIRSTDPAQTDAVISELGQYLNRPEQVMQVVAVLRELAARSVGGAISMDPQEPPQE